jgi:hypothetical protein
MMRIGGWAWNIDQRRPASSTAVMTTVAATPAAAPSAATTVLLEVGSIGDE